MMPTIRVSEEVWRFLKNNAEPFEDTPDTVLRRLLGLEKRNKRGRGTHALGRTPQSDYRIPILKALDELGGRGRVNRVLKLVRKRMTAILKHVDYDKISTGMERWRNAAMWERKAMVDEGLLKSDSSRGIWEMTERGSEYLEKHE